MGIERKWLEYMFSVGGFDSPHKRKKEESGTDKDGRKR